LRADAATLQKWIVPTCVVVSWEVLGRAAAVPTYLSYPSNILAALWEVTADGELLRAVIASLYRVIGGFAIGTALGMCVGLGAGMVRGVRNFFDPLVSFLFAVPKIAFLPVFLLLFGIGHTSKIAIVAFSCFFPVFIAARHAVLSVDRQVLWAARNMGTPPRKMFFRVLIPATAPQLFAGVRISLAHAFIVLFAAELIGSHAGLGQLIAEGDDAARFDLMFAGIFTFAVLGFAGDRVLMAVRIRVLKGQTLGTEEQVVR
jgi:NitT/TauT family transport system permease protein/sulfonate transport system permease protein